MTQRPSAVRRRVRAHDHPAALAFVGGPVPADDEAVLGGEEVRSLVEIDEVVRVALEALLVGLLLAAGEFDDLVTELPALELAVVPVPMAYDFRHALDELDGILVDAAEDQAAAVRRNGETETEVGLSAPSLPAVKEFVGLAGEGLGLRARIWRPRKMRGGALHVPGECLPIDRIAGANPFDDLVEESGAHRPTDHQR
jgi:hypothetical protein